MIFGFGLEQQRTAVSARTNLTEHWRGSSSRGNAWRTAEAPSHEWGLEITLLSLVLDLARDIYSQLSGVHQMVV